jgi:HrpA-like RNA helicase
LPSPKKYTFFNFAILPPLLYIFFHHTTIDKKWKYLYAYIMNYLELPVYKNHQKILSALKENQAVVVESPTGSGKTTQLPLILYEAGYSDKGMIGVTQPRRIAAVSVSEFIARQMETPLGGIVGYKMRFEDRTGSQTKIKIMTDGMLLQELKLDPCLSKYSVIVVDEAHERSLNIDFTLGLLKRVLESRRDFKVIISSATINAEVFREYFNGCPVVKIDAQRFPVTLIYEPPATEDELLEKTEKIVKRFIAEKHGGDILIFLSGEKAIKDCMNRLSLCRVGGKLHLLPLYGRLGKEEQERVFEPAPKGRTKVVLSTNIAETSVTIEGITAVIDSGLSKLNWYNPNNFTSSLIEAPVSKASADQRKGRAGRTCEGSCYRLYTRKDFENRQQFTTEEIFRTDLSEVILRMADLGITDFEDFDFISTPGKEGLVAGIETLNLLNALESDRSLSNIGKMMTQFPLAPRQSRIIVEAILRYPHVLRETLIASAFLSTQSPYILPPGEETEARKAHGGFHDQQGDFVSYLKIFKAFVDSSNKAKFCDRNYLDEKAMAEIVNVTAQLEEILASLNIPVPEGNSAVGNATDYLCCIGKGMIQFVCVRKGGKGGASKRGGISKRNVTYRSLTADQITIHPGSVMFRSDPQYIVAGEIVRTSRMYAMSVSPLSREILERLGIKNDELGIKPACSRTKKHPNASRRR